MDASEARGLAGRMRGAGRDVGEVGGQVRAVERVRWRCVAADVFREAVMAEASSLVRVEGALDAAASAWQRHAAALDEPW